MKAIAITPGIGNPQLIDVDEPQINSSDQVKIETIQVGICGTDREEVHGGRADPPAGNEKLIIGHEMFGRVVETGKNVLSVKPGDFALFTVRRGCGYCKPCLNNRSDMCFTGEYSERGIKGLDGFQAELIVDEEKYLVKIPEDIKEIAVLTEPMSVVEKAFHESINLQTARFPKSLQEDWLKGKKTLVAGIGSVGLLASFLLRLHDAEVFGLDIVDKSSLRPSIFKSLGGKYINGNEIHARDIDDIFGEMDFIFEATGVAQLEFQLLDALGINGVYVLTGIPSDDRPVKILGGSLMKQMVLKNQILLGSVNASIDHYRYAVEDLKKINEKWGDLISKMITEIIPYQEFEKAFGNQPTDEIKTVIEWRTL